MQPAFELLVASRYLRADRPPGSLNRLRWATFGLILVTAAIYGGDRLVEYYMRDHLSELLWDLRSVLRVAKYVVVALTVLVGFFLELIRRLTIFTSISTFGLFLGTAALVTALSVMSGFEQDLKGKILGTHAHMVVTTPDRQFTDYREVLAKVEKVPGVTAATPYLTSEVMIASSSNLSGVIIKGIDPTTIGRVTELAKNTQQGSLDNLLHPELLRLLGSGSATVPAGPSGGSGALAAIADGTDGGATPDGGAGGASDTSGASDAGGAGLAAPELAVPVKAGAAAEATAKPSAAEAGKGTAESAERSDEPTDEQLAEKFDEQFAEKKRLERQKPRSERKILPGVVVGRELAKNLRVFVGDDVNVISPMGDIGPTGPIPKAKPFRTAAIFFSGMYEYDSKYVYMALPAAQKFLGLGDEVTGLELKLDNPEDSGAVMERVRAALGPGGFETADWKELNRSLFSALKLEKIAMFIALCFIIVVAAFSIVSNGIMLVLEKGREVAILKSMGASDGAVQRIFVLLGLYMGVLGTTFGVLTGCGVCWALDHFGLPLDTDVYYITKLPVNVNPGELLAVLFASLMLSLLATLYPARLAAQLRPVDGLR